MRTTGLLTIMMSATAAIVTLLSTGGFAQQNVPFRGNTPIAPQGIPKLALPDHPVVYDTAEGQPIRVVVHASGLSHPWSLAFFPDGTMLITERDGRLRLIRNGSLDPNPLTAPRPSGALVSPGNGAVLRIEPAS
jgi:glucose/arabinose dehydrogenase